MKNNTMNKILLTNGDIMLVIEAMESYIDNLKAGHCDLAVKEFKSVLDEVTEQGGFNE